MKISGKKISRMTLGAVVLGLLVFGSQGASAQETDKARAVGSVVDIDGPQLKTNRLKEEKWYQAYRTMPTLYKERLIAGPDTSATIEFAVGGRAVIAPGSKVEVLNEDVLKIESGTVWAKFDGEKWENGPKKFQIQTAGGVMGIEGTEFLVKEDASTGQTQLVVVEGTVGVDGKESVSEGDSASFNETAYKVAKFGVDATTPWGRRQAAYDLLNVPSEARYVMNRALWYTPGRNIFGSHFYGRNYWMASTALYAIRNPKGAAISVVNRQTRGIGGGLAGMALSKAWEPPKPVRSIRVDGATPKFDWEGSKGTDKYAVVVANDSKGEDVVWYGVTEGKRSELSYPDYGPELKANQRYYLFVSSLDKEGKPRAFEGTSLSGETSFVAKGHVPTYQTIERVVALGSTETPEVKWKSVKKANGYKVKIETADGTTEVWSDESMKPEYTYPESARALEPGDYSVTVTAFDETGVKMAESQPVTFATSGWKAIGLEGPPRTDTEQEQKPEASIESGGGILSLLKAALR